MNAHTRRVLGRTVRLIADYERGAASLGRLVRDLEGSLDALEEKLPDAFYAGWFGCFGELEIAVALGGDGEHHDAAVRAARGLAEFVEQWLRADAPHDGALLGDGDGT